jgi:Tfp pilus assembly protein PilW
MWSRFRRTFARESGVSIAELTVTLSVFLIVATAMYTLFAVVQRTTIRQDARNQVTGEMRIAMERLTKEIRQASVVHADSTDAVLHIDTYENDVATTTTWTAAGTTLTRTEGTSSQLLVDGLLSTSIFAYSPTTTGATDITITLRARPKNYSTDPAVVELVSQVRLRNRGSS